jgi:SAM-dependent methyltransferase
VSNGDSDIPDLAGTPSAFFVAHTAQLVETAPIGPALDLACGRGRHALALAALGLSVTAIDANSDSLDELMAQRLRMIGGETGPIETLCADLETPPLPDLVREHYGAVLVFNYLHRALFPWIESLVAPGGLVLYETFTEAQRTLGWGPRRDAFLLSSGELPELLPNLVTEVYREGLSNDARPAQSARLLARRPLPRTD